MYIYIYTFKATVILISVHKTTITSCIPQKTTIVPKNSSLNRVTA